MLMRHTHDTTFSEKKSWFLQNFRREWTVFHFIFKDNGISEAVFPLVLEDRTLSGTPPNSLQWKNVFLDVDNKHMY
jgi:hypothetical protein